LNISDHFEQSADMVLFHGDTTDLLKEIPDEMMQLVVTSPPYNIGKEHETRTTIQKYLDSQKNIIKEIIRVLSPNGSILMSEYRQNIRVKDISRGRTRACLPAIRSAKILPI
jgi:DNA modification methylase